MERKRIFQPLFYSSNGSAGRTTRGQTQEWESHPTDSRKPCTWAIIHCLPKHDNRKMDQKLSSLEPKGKLQYKKVGTKVAANHAVPRSQSLCMSADS